MNDKDLLNFLDKLIPVLDHAAFFMLPAGNISTVREMKYWAESIAYNIRKDNPELPEVVKETPVKKAAVRREDLTTDEERQAWDLLDVMAMMAPDFERSEADDMKLDAAWEEYIRRWGKP